MFSDHARDIRHIHSGFIEHKPPVDTGPACCRSLEGRKNPTGAPEIMIKKEGRRSHRKTSSCFRRGWLVQLEIEEHRHHGVDNFFPIRSNGKADWRAAFGQ